MSEAAGRRVTASDVAREAGVSRATVGFVMSTTRRQSISTSTQERVFEAARRLGYRPNGTAQALATGRSRIVLLVLPGWPVNFGFRAYLDEASQVLHEAGYSLVTYAHSLVTYTHQPTGAARPLWESLNPEIVIGMAPFSPDDLASMHSCGIRRIFPDPAGRDPLDLSMLVSVGPRLQVSHLQQQGFLTMVYAAFDEPNERSLVEARHRAARDQAESFGLPPLHLRFIDDREGSASRAVRDWHAAGVTGVVAFNDEVAAAVVGAAIRQGIQVPGELAVIGHDDAPIGRLFVPALSTVHFDATALGRAFANFALAQLEDRPPAPWHTPTSATLVRRESTQPTTNGTDRRCTQAGPPASAD
ncbi:MULTISPECIES: LacI family DNA-binding transcriptional regulator [Pseudofrankia]|uniref:LacI family DNA-binding transcriptional regulator n=1 Tax=Pseudofrankia TaxID=2994363 RepID=UPI000234B0FF|nr:MULTISPECIES: LacI family DNA-binding transcriptional regulator [Pseudofrankia]OHV41022.1 LacI family transcriptional regulator [Pseudofrankia sp. EUN1h]